METVLGMNKLNSGLEGGSGSDAVPLNLTNISTLFDKISGISDSSKKLFKTKLSQWLSWFGDGSLSALATFLQNPRVASECLSKAPITQTNSNKHMFYSAVATLFRHDAIPPGIFKTRTEQDRAAQEWLAVQKKNSESLRAHYTENTPTAKQNSVENVAEISWSDILAVREKLAVGSLERLLMLVYTAMPPVRADHYATEIVFYPSSPTAPNYLLIKSPRDMTFIIRDFKTARLYDLIRSPLPQIVREEVAASLSLNPRKWLFVDGRGLPFERKRFSEWSGRILSGIMGSGRHLTINTLRHLYITQHVDFNQPVKKLEKIGAAMGHSVGMQKAYHWVGDKEEQEEREGRVGK